MKKSIYLLIIPLILIGGGIYASRMGKTDPTKKIIAKSPTKAEIEAAKRNWEASPDGKMYKKWETSDAGKKVFVSESKIRKSINNFSEMEGEITSLSLPPGSRLGFGVMVKINGDDFILSCGIIKPTSTEYKLLHDLKVNDKIKIKSHSVMHAPKYTYPIVYGDYIELDGKVVYKREPRKGGC